MVQRSQMTTTREEVLGTLEEELPGLGPFERAEAVEDGTRCENWLVRARDRRLLVKFPATVTVAHQRSDIGYPAAVAASRFLRQHGLRAATVHLDGHLRAGRPVLVLDWIDGVTGARLLAGGADPQVFAEVAARTLAELHSTTVVDHFSESLAPSATRHRRWSTLVAAHLERSVDKLRRVGIDGDAENEHLVTETLRRAVEVDDVVVPTFCNGNIYSNMFVSPTARWTTPCWSTTRRRGFVTP